MPRKALFGPYYIPTQAPPLRGLLLREEAEVLDREAGAQARARLLLEDLERPARRRDVRLQLRRTFASQKFAQCLSSFWQTLARFRLYRLSRT